MRKSVHGSGRSLLLPAVSLPQHIGDQCLVHTDSSHVATEDTSNSVWASRGHMPAVLSVGEVLVPPQPPQIGCSDGTSARPSTYAAPERVDFRIRFSTISSPLLLLPHRRCVGNVSKMVIVVFSLRSRHAPAHTLSHMCTHAPTHSKDKHPARTQLGNVFPHFLFDAP